MKTKKKNTLKLFLIFITSLFSIVFFLSIPVLYNYESLQNKIEKQFFSEFNIELEILGKISRKNFPRPHLIIKKANLGLKENNLQKKPFKVDNLKILLSYKNILTKANIEITSIEIQKSNIKLNYGDFKNLRRHLYYKINKPIIIKNSKFFYLDKNSNTILISPIDNLKYFINEKNNSKELKVIGNIFDSNFKSLWTRKYDKPNQTNHEVSFKDPNLIYKNLLNIEKNNNFSGIGLVKFLDQEIKIKYSKQNEKILLSSPSSHTNSKIKIISNIELNPFYFDMNIILIDKKINFVLENFLHILSNVSPESLGNLNGDLIVDLREIDDDLFDNGKIKVVIDENRVKFKETYLEIENIGIIKSEFTLNDSNGELLFISNNILEIKNKKEFARKFQLNIKKLENINKIYFNLQNNISSNIIYLSNIEINEKSNKTTEDNFYRIKNINELKSLLRKILAS